MQSNSCNLGSTRQTANFGLADATNLIQMEIKLKFHAGMGGHTTGRTMTEQYRVTIIGFVTGQNMQRMSSLQIMWG